MELFLLQVKKHMDDLVLRVIFVRLPVLFYFFKKTLLKLMTKLLSEITLIYNK